MQEGETGLQRFWPTAVSPAEVWNRLSEAGTTKRLDELARKVVWYRLPQVPEFQFDNDVEHLPSADLLAHLARNGAPDDAEHLSPADLAEVQRRRPYACSWAMGHALALDYPDSAERLRIMMGRAYERADRFAAALPDFLAQREIVDKAALRVEEALALLRAAGSSDGIKLPLRERHGWTKLRLSEALAKLNMERAPIRSRIPASS